MSDLQEQLKINHAPVFLTLVSVVVALALEDLLSLVRASPVLWQADTASLRLWLKVLLALEASFLLWVAYSGLLLSLRWVFGVWDAAQVFFLAIILYAFNSVAFLESGHFLLYTAALFPFSGCGVLWSNLHRASQYPENEEVLRRAAYRGTLLLGAALTGTILVFAILVHTGAVGDTAESLFGLATIVAFALWLSFFMRAWRRSVSAQPDLVAVGSSSRTAAQQADEPDVE
jgi:hypothetical protein